MFTAILVVLVLVLGWFLFVAKRPNQAGQVKTYAQHAFDWVKSKFN